MNTIEPHDAPNEKEKLRQQIEPLYQATGRSCFDGAVRAVTKRDVSGYPGSTRLVELDITGVVFERVRELTVRQLDIKLGCIGRRQKLVALSETTTIDDLVWWARGFTSPYPGA